MKPIVAKLAAIEPMHLVSRTSSSATPSIVPRMDLRDDDQPYASYYLVRVADLTSVATRHVPAQGHWIVDVISSPVIEFGMCHVGEGIIRRERVYFTDGCYAADGQWIQKPESFRGWGMKVLRTIKKSLVLLSGGSYIGADAAARVERGESVLRDM